MKLTLKSNFLYAALMVFFIILDLLAEVVFSFELCICLFEINTYILRILTEILFITYSMTFADFLHYLL